MTSRAARIASASTQPPPSVPTHFPESSSTSLAPATCGVLPCVRTTVATANRLPASRKRVMWWNSESLLRLGMEVGWHIDVPRRAGIFNVQLDPNSADELERL